LAAGGVTGILLVGGASSRFGSPKPLATFEGETLAERAWRTLGHACDERFAVGKRADHLELPFDVVDDGTDVRAALAGIVAGLRASATDLNVVVPVDVPLLRARDLRELAAACRDAAVSETGPLPCAIRRSTLRFFEARLARGELALRNAFGELDTALVPVDAARLANANTRSDLDALEVRIVPMRDEHAQAFRKLVTDSLREFGFEATPELDPDLADPTSYYAAAWVATLRDDVVGSIALRRVAGREVELKRMYLRQELRGRGVGKRLLQMAFTWAREHKVERITLDTTDEMKAARHLYESHGFVRVAGDAPRQGHVRLLYERRV
jgi:molybdopterin-guanine dinucleotide biosynthesis protein A/GNAT superfamily N-acetyltransferase